MCSFRPLSIRVAKNTEAMPAAALGCLRGRSALRWPGRLELEANQGYLEPQPSWSWAQGLKDLRTYLVL